MALLLQSADIKGLTAKNVYVKVDSFEGSRDSIDFYVHYYVSQEVAQTQPENFLRRDYYRISPDLNSVLNFIQQMYEYLKTLPEFLGAIDILEEVRLEA